MQRTYLSILGGIQPQIAGGNLVTEERTANGLAARFGVIVYPHRQRFDYVDAVVDTNIERKCDERIRMLRALSNSVDKKHEQY